MPPLSAQQIMEGKRPFQTCVREPNGLESLFSAKQSRLTQAQTPCLIAHSLIPDSFCTVLQGGKQTCSKLFTLQSYALAIDLKKQVKSTK